MKEIEINGKVVSLLEVVCTPDEAVHVHVSYEADTLEGKGTHTRWVRLSADDIAEGLATGKAGNDLPKAVSLGLAVYYITGIALLSVKAKFEGRGGK